MRLHRHRWRGGAVALGLVLGLALVALIVPAVGGQPAPTVALTVDLPTDGSVIANGQPVDIGGWAVDAAAPIGTGVGVDAVTITVPGPPGGAERQVAAQLGTARPDVAEQFGRPDWSTSGFTATWTPVNLAPGPATLTVAAHSPRSGWTTRTLTVVVVGPVAPLPPAPPPGNPPAFFPPVAPGPAAPAGPPAVPPPAPSGPGYPPLAPCSYSSYSSSLPHCPR